MTTTPTSGAADLPEALRSIQRFEVVDCIDDKHVPAVIPKPHGPWVRYEDHIAALAAGQAAAAQQGAAYAALPEYGINTASHAHFRVLGFTADQMRAFADATHTLRASHGQAPAQAASSAVLKAIREANMQLVRTGDDAFMLVPYKAVTAQAADSVTAPAPPPECETEAEKRAFAFGWFKALESERMKAESVQEDAARYRWLRERSSTMFVNVSINGDGAEIAETLDSAVDAARKQGEKQ